MWQCLDAHFDTFLEIYPEAYECEYGFLRPIIPEAVEKFMGCGDFAKRFARVRYYGWYSNKMRGQRLKRAEPDAGSEVIEVSAFKPRRIPSKKWRELLKKVCEADPLLCPHCQNEMRIIALIDETAVIERILRRLGLWEAGARVDEAHDAPMTRL